MNDKLERLIQCYFIYVGIHACVVDFEREGKMCCGFHEKFVVILREGEKRER